MASVSTDSVRPTYRQPSSSNSSTSSSDQQQESVLLSERDVREIIERKIRGKKFSSLNWTIRPLGEQNGLLGQYYILNATITVDATTRNFSFFCKIPPPSGSPQEDFLRQHDTFNKEITMYTEVVPLLGVGNEPFKFFVECYFSKKDTIVVLEDATVDGYVMPDKYVPLDVDHLTWSFKALARFHSGSLIFDAKAPSSGGKSIYDLYGDRLKELVFNEGDELADRALQASINGCYALLDIVDSLKPDQRSLLKKRTDNWCRKMAQLIQPSKKYKNVICHRDLWANNLMFKYDSTNKPIGCYLVDFQFCLYCPPALDVVSLLYLTTNRAVRDGYFEHFVKMYHETVKEALAEQGLDVESCLPWQTFVESCEEARNVVMPLAFLNLQVMLLTKETIHEYFTGACDRLAEYLYTNKRAEVSSHQFRTMEPFRTRITEIIFEMLERLPEHPPESC